MSDELIELNGKRILVVEDDFILASIMRQQLERLGATIIGPAPTPFYALQLMGRRDRRWIDAAVLDVNLHGTKVFDVADTLQERGIPFLFVTGYAQEHLPRRFAEGLVLQKPVTPEALHSAIIALVRRPKPTIVIPRPVPSFQHANLPILHFARALARAMGGKGVVPMAEQDDAIPQETPAVPEQQASLEQVPASLNVDADRDLCLED